jgi:hypothetical protein
MNDFYLLAASETSNLAALFRGWRDDTMEFVPIRVPMILVKTLLNKQYPVSRELRRRIKNCVLWVKEKRRLSELADLLFYQ